MNTNTKLWAGAILLLSSAYAILAGHDLLARSLASHPLLDGWATMPTRLATFCGLLVAHGFAGVFILPLVRRLGVADTAATICVGTAAFAVTGRVAAELVTGMFVAGYPVLSVAVMTTVMSVVLAPRLRRGALGVRVMAGGGRGPHLASHGSATRALRESA